MSGKARLLLAPAAVEALLQHVPTWHACVYGPVPFGQEERYHLTINNILRPDREGALEAVENNAREVCAAHGVPYDEDEWEIYHLVLRHGN